MSIENSTSIIESFYHNDRQSYTTRLKVGVPKNTLWILLLLFKAVNINEIKNMLWQYNKMDIIESNNGESKYP